MDITLNLASIDQLVSEAREYFFLNVLSWAMAAQIANGLQMSFISI